MNSKSQSQANFYRYHIYTDARRPKFIHFVNALADGELSLCSSHSEFLLGLVLKLVYGPCLWIILFLLIHTTYKIYK